MAVSTPKQAKKAANTAETSPKTTKKAVETAENDPFLYSISALSRKFKLDRATVKERLDTAEIKPKVTRAKEKLYHLDDVEIVLSQSELNEAKLEKLRLEGERLAHDLAVKRGEFASVAEFTEIVQRIFGRLYKNLAVQMPSKVSGRLHNANSSAELAQILKTEISKEFDALRSDFKKYL